MVPIPMILPSVCMRRTIIHAAPTGHATLRPALAAGKRIQLTDGG
jgi:hypothetical protein